MAEVEQRYQYFTIEQLQISASIDTSVANEADNNVHAVLPAKQNRAK